MILLISSEFENISFRTTSKIRLTFLPLEYLQAEEEEVAAPPGKNNNKQYLNN